MRTVSVVGAVVLIRAVVWLGIQMADADFRDALRPEPANASYILVEPQQMWEPLVMCPAGMGCI